jgi:uncharacterized protein YoxC
MEKEKIKTINKLERFSIQATRWIGSLESLVVHTVFFSGIFSLVFFGVAIEKILLTVTTIVSYEAIYLSIFIQMSVNRQARKLKAVARDVEEIQEDVEEIQEDVEEIQEDVEGIEKDVEEIQEDVEEIQEDVEGIEKDVEEIQEDVEEIQEESEEDEKIEEAEEKKNDVMLSRIENTLGILISEITELKKQQDKKVRTKIKK